MLSVTVQSWSFWSLALLKYVAGCEGRGLGNSGSHHLSLTSFHFLLERLKAVMSLTEK